MRRGKACADGDTETGDFWKCRIGGSWRTLEGNAEEMKINELFKEV